MKERRKGKERGKEDKEEEEGINVNARPMIHGYAAAKIEEIPPPNGPLARKTYHLPVVPSGL